MLNIKSSLALKNLPSTPWKVLSFDLAVWLLVSTIYWINNVNLKSSLIWLFFGVGLGFLALIPVMFMLLSSDKYEETQHELLYSKFWIFCLAFFNLFLIMGLFYLSDIYFLLSTEPLQPLGL